MARYAEIGLKSIPVRTRFENRLKENMLDMLAADGIEAIVTKGEARFYIEAVDIDAAVRSLKRVFGVASLSVAEVTTANLDDICRTAAEYSLSRFSDNQRFAVRARREGNHHPFTSMDVGREAGSAIFEANVSKNPIVDLTNPEKVFYVEVRNNKTYIFDSYIKCHAGLPLGTQGKVIAEVENDRGVVSAWLMMKRGCKVVLKGNYGKNILDRYDPDLRSVTGEGDPRRVQGYVRGTSMEELEGMDVSFTDLPVFFPTVGMTDVQVEAMLADIMSD